MTKEEIFPEYNNGWSWKNTDYKNVLAAMEQYAIAQTADLRKELEETTAISEFKDGLIRDLQRDLKTANNAYEIRNNDVKIVEKELEYIKQKLKESENTASQLAEHIEFKNKELEEVKEELKQTVLDLSFEIKSHNSTKDERDAYKRQTERLAEALYKIQNTCDNTFDAKKLESINAIAYKALTQYREITKTK